MPGIEVRPFRRADRDEVAELVNRHAAAVMPGVAASVNTVLGQFEREPDEFVVGPWTAERRALVAEQSGSVVAAALVVRYRDDPDVGPAYRGVGEIRWLVFRPMAPIGNPYWQDGRDAARSVMQACLSLMQGWRVSRVVADGALPVPGVYGVPEQWPHVEQLYEEFGFACAPERVELVHLADLGRIPDPGDPPVDGVEVRRLVGINGTRLEARRAGEQLGYVEAEVLDPVERHPRHVGLADVGNLHVVPAWRRRGVGSWLLRHAAGWLRLGRADRLLHYATPGETDVIAFVERHGFVEVTRTRRGWERAL